ncbi:arylamine N-acetyltransferase-like protein 1 [Lasiosphaeria miniovina]|uniref:Arylamine N-acetyltransferase-like protein 1 n=1 Tax=Lasiosphaeria miniovina TaxID=1954250 RepID=A0AA40B3I6_9PEZI|nr:arylamine N-acetyltransferase-like protein 1 [Lasiosphaeria miniovina]KAK0727015.1 arylamine N-acetyltransferase-like protein 1 [Lasiosphaeria miniovina]
MSTLNDSAYSASQVAEYLDVLGLPASFHPSANPVLDLSYLTALFVHQVTTVPYENLIIHYSPQHEVVLDPQALFAKMVTNRARGRGGYCMETSILFNHMLRAIGFDVYTAGVRVRPRDANNVPCADYMGYVHLVNIVTLPGPLAEPAQKYALDVGFGGDGPTLPMPLTAGLVHHNSIGTQEVRLVREFLPFQRRRRPGYSGAGVETDGDASLMHWVYQYRNDADRPWVACYAFSEFEFGEADFHIVNYFTSKAPTSFQSYTPVAVLFLRGQGQEGRSKVVGKVMLIHGLVKRNVTGRTELAATCATEAERVAALAEYLGIRLTADEAASIRGRAPELVGAGNLAAALS